LAEAGNRSTPIFCQHPFPTWEERGLVVAKILCVDDEPAAVALKQTILERAGHSVTTCYSANDAIALLAKEPFDAVVTDWKLGEESGHQILLAAKTGAQVPVVVVSGFCTDAFRATEPQADIYLEKPVDATELVAIIRALLQSASDDHEDLRQRGA
jgi:DNA-binding response OmpR family regulator